MTDKVAKAGLFPEPGRSWKVCFGQELLFDAINHRNHAVMEAQCGWFEILWWFEAQLSGKGCHCEDAASGYAFQLFCRLTLSTERLSQRTGTVQLKHADLR